MARQIEFLTLLNSRAENDTIRVSVSGGKSFVAKTKAEIIKQLYPNLIGKPITITDASQKYKISRRTLQHWAKSDYIAVIKPGYRMTVDEADVAYCVRVFNQRKNIFKNGVPLLDENGLPYQLKHPNLSQKRRQQPAA